MTSPIGKCDGEVEGALDPQTLDDEGSVAPSRVWIADRSDARRLLISIFGIGQSS